MSNEELKKEIGSQLAEKQDQLISLIGEIDELMTPIGRDIIAQRADSYWLATFKAMLGSYNGEKSFEMCTMEDTIKELLGEDGAE